MNAQKEVVIITGSNGLIGYATAKRLAEHFAVVGLIRKGPPYPPRSAEVVSVDVSSDESVQRGLIEVRKRHGGRIASVIHLAAYYDFSGEPSPKYGEVTVRGTGRLLHALQGFDVEQFIFSSTMLVHAPCSVGQRINEDWPLEPKWIYPQSKLQAEELIRAQRGTIPAVLLRLAGVYDDQCHSPPHMHQMQRIFERKLISHVYPGHLEHGQAYLHLDDLVDVFLLLVQQRAHLPPELTLLIGETETLSFGEQQHLLGYLIHGEDWETIQIPKVAAKTGAWLKDAIPGEDPFIKPWMIDLADDHYALDITRARTLLGWQPQHSLRDTVPKMVAALKANPLGWYKEMKLEPPAWLEEAVSLPAQEESHAGKDKSQPHDGQHEGMRPDQGAVAHGEHEGMMREMHQSTLWVHFAAIALGVWLVSSPFALGYLDIGLAGAVLEVSAERGLPTVEWRNAAMAWSDVLSGILIILFGALSLSRRFGWAQWANTFVGLWLLFAPLVFWTPSPAAYFNDTLVGTLVIALAILIPMMPGMDMQAMMSKTAIPPGWTYCPSTYLQRLPIIALAMIGFFIARYLTAYQMGHIKAAWDPFFGAGTMTIITSDTSKAWPIPDAGLGAVAYMLEVLMGIMGGKDRWRTMPWMVTMFGVLVVPLGGVSIFFIIIQPIVIGTWCSLCLIAALVMVIMIPYSLDELVAMGQFLLQTRREGKPFWRTFWQGGTLAGGSEDNSAGFGATPSTMVMESVRGVTLPWTLLLSAALGVWLMFTRLIFGTEGTMANSDHLVGSLVVTIAVTAMAEVARPLRFINLLFGVWLIVAPWLLSGATTVASWAGVGAGIALILLNIPRGRVRQRYGTWDRYIV